MMAKPGDDLSYYLGPEAKQATAEQCEQLEHNFAAANSAASVGEECPWHPRETAPRDGTHILVCVGPFSKHWTFRHKPPVVVHYFNDPEAPGFYLSSGIVADSYNDEPYHFTHWRELGQEPL